VRLIRRALRENWPIPAEARPKVIAQLMEVIDDPHSSPRETTAAAASLLQASRVNLEAVSVAMKVEEHEVLKGRLAAIEGRLSAKGDIDGELGVDDWCDREGDR
jgi:hypothetical protein